MNHKGPQKHSPETIQKAIALYESGAKLTAIARQFGVQKSTAKYWLDNAGKHDMRRTGPGPIMARLLKQIAHTDLEVRLKAYNTLKSKLSEASLEEALEVLCKLPSQQHSWPTISAAAALTKGETERSEVHITVKKFLEKQQNGQPEEPDKNLGAAAPEPFPGATTSQPPDAPAQIEGAADGAN